MPKVDAPTATSAKAPGVPAEMPPLFAGATHRNAATGEPVKATLWAKDGDHPNVVRYPVEKREFKGLLVAGKKERFALRFGDYVVEDAAGRVWVVQPYADGSGPSGYVTAEKP